MKWKWFSYVYSLAKGDILKFEEVVKLNFVFTLNVKAFEQENQSIRDYFISNGRN